MPRRDAPVALAVAAGFLTRLPVHRDAATGDLARAAPLFPLVGAALGAAVGSTALACASVVPPLIAGAIAVAVELAVTGALHADGLADSADGLAGRDREHALAIMRDHAVGVYGASALVLDLLAKAAALGTLGAEGEILGVVAVFALSRAVPLVLAAALPYARPGTGTGRLLAERATLRSTAAGATLAVAIAAAAVRVDALALIACSAAVAVAVALAARRRIGGVTGDVMGAATELAATTGLIVLVVLVQAR
jgi:adenosylcobinamide-GDP ribazoletransferase